MGQAARGSPAAILAFVLWTRGKVHAFSRAFYRRGLFGLVLLRLPQSVTADVELQDDAVDVQIGRWPIIFKQYLAEQSIVLELAGV